MTSVHQPDCLMINASAAAYCVIPNTSWQRPVAGSPNANYYDNVGWTELPAPVVAGDDGTDAALVGTAQASIDGATVEAVIVAFRGTVAPDGPAPVKAQIYDWIIDDLFGSRPVGVPQFGPGACVHEGWWNAVGAMWGPLTQQLTALYASQPARPLLFTGHSKGGPMATLAAAKLWASHHDSLLTDIPLPTVVTFASPHPGNEVFAATFDAAITQRRWEYAKDLVPLLPPTDVVADAFIAYVDVSDLGELEKLVLKGLLNTVKSWKFTSVGSLEYIDRSGNRAILGLGELERLAVDIIPEVKKSGVGALAAAHCHGCPGTGCDGGYMSGACAGTCCSS